MATAPQAFRRFPAAVSGFTGRLHLLSHAQPFNDQMSKQWRNTCGFQRFLYNSTWLLWWDSKTWWLNRPAWNWNMGGGDKHGQQWPKKRSDPPKWVKIRISHSQKLTQVKGKNGTRGGASSLQLWHVLPALPNILLATVPLSSPSISHLFIYWYYWSLNLRYAFIAFISQICLLNLR